jgi:hypothetical protein
MSSREVERKSFPEKGGVVEGAADSGCILAMGEEFAMLEAKRAAVRASDPTDGHC